ncbi:MAG: tRNA preQ1(34) S-adenosylmethionine ribosyltransferase-isomerase QueA [Limnochordia bacterium]|jgi:S-adenosylmethionine:tRNA ribosyltransferase-isomerase|nr:tRNA preQ1(34) S-adenosylmethionine ribosyltransferase-isomerase QueA [Limnochordia bacterium]MDD2628709.1 tRNA preQ1(34) S-adenosylmethionine ribosyltransferase-isomerase QueA [Limnochordia bacterium]MDD4517060.1 tRNA preQ1(34) S-adenosylmethionine ribosyltransferase-isomerase QueA [Limnochordia bacterium]
MRTEEFYYELPKELIAQAPAKRRDAAKLMVAKRWGEGLIHSTFANLPDFLQAGDLLVLNDSKVLPARLLGRRPDTLGRVELLLLSPVEGQTWQVLMKRAKRVKLGERLIFGQGELMGTVVAKEDEGKGIVEFESCEPLMDAFAKVGQVPLPPYITRDPFAMDRERYQTVYAKELGSAAAPTAGLHFTKELLRRIEAKGVGITALTLHIGLGTFRPVQTEKIEDHKMHAEFFEISKDCASLINKTKGQGGRVIAVGTTVARTLEAVSQTHGKVCQASGWTDIFIYPGYEFKVIDGLITNFHLPCSTLLMLVCAFGGTKFMLDAYQLAVDEKYAFYSYGDGMLII